MKQLDIPVPRSQIAHSVEEAEEISKKIGLPVVIRPPIPSVEQAAA